MPDAPYEGHLACALGSWRTATCARTLSAAASRGRCCWEAGAACAGRMSAHPARCSMQGGSARPAPRSTGRPSHPRCCKLSAQFLEPDALAVMLQGPWHRTGRCLQLPVGQHKCGASSSAGKAHPGWRMHAEHARSLVLVLLLRRGLGGALPAHAHQLGVGALQAQLVVRLLLLRAA